MNSRARFSLGALAVLLARPASATWRRRSASCTPASRKSPSDRVRSFWFCAAMCAAARTFCAEVAKWLCHSSVNFSCTGCCTATMRRSHQSDSTPCLFGQLPVVLLAGRRRRALARGARRGQRRHRGGDRARVGVGIRAQHGVDVGRPVPGHGRIDLGAGHPEPGPPQHAGRGDPLRGLPRAMRRLWLSFLAIFLRPWSGACGSTKPQGARDVGFCRGMAMGNHSSAVRRWRVAR